MSDKAAASTNDAAELLGAVASAQSSTNLSLRARFPELFVLLSAGLAASVIGRDHNTADPAVVVVGFAGALIFGTLILRRRRNLGGAMARSVWVVAALLFAVSVTCNLVVHGTAEGIALGVCLALALLVLAALLRSSVLAVVGVLILAAAFVPEGAFDKAVSIAVGAVAALLIAWFAGVRPRFHKKP